MTEVVIVFLTALGGCVTIALVLLGAELVLDWIKEKVEQARLNHNIKHRFDKPPTAKCYCRDCVYYGENGWKNSAMCCRFKRCVADNWFCWEAEPIKHERSDDAGGQAPHREDV